MPTGVWYTVGVTMPNQPAALPAQRAALRKECASPSNEAARAWERLPELDSGTEWASRPAGGCTRSPRSRRLRLLVAGLFLGGCLTFLPGPGGNDLFVQRLYAAPPSPRPRLTVNVSDSPLDSRAPGLAVSSEATHFVWEEDDRLYHRSWNGSAWSTSRSIAVGEQPAIGTDSSGRAHVVFVNEFGGNYEIYHCQWTGASWSLPRNVSNTSGVSSSPRLDVASDGTIHVVWADNTPGYNVIYHAHWDGTYWLNEPVPNAFGGAPAVAVSGDGAVHLTWQDRDAQGAPYEVYYSRWTGSSWSLPEDLSDTAAEQSIIPGIAIGPGGRAHVAWQERDGGSYAVDYTYGSVGYWSIPERLSQSALDAYLPSLAVNAVRTVYVGWDEGTLALYRQRGSDALGWSPCSQVSDDAGGVTDLQLAIDITGQLHAAWVQRASPSNWDVFYQNLTYPVFLPVVARANRK